MLVVRTDGLWVYGQVITKFSLMGRLPHFLTQGATLLESSSMIPVPHFLYIPVNFAFNLPHYVTSYMQHTGKRESKKQILKKRGKKERKNYEKFPLGDSNPDRQNQLELKVNASIHWTTSLNVDNSSLKEVYIPSLW